VWHDVSASPAHRIADAALPSRYGEFRIAVYGTAEARGSEVVVLTHGRLPGTQPALVRLHSECVTGDVLGSLRCDCGAQLEAALYLLGRADPGVLLYLPQEGRGIGIANKVRAYALQDAGLDTVDANLALGLPIDSREYATAASVLRQLGLAQVRLLTNNPLKTKALEDNGIVVVERVPITVPPNPANRRYLRTKARRMGHLFESAAD
jgi:GTP cyclohydrolase II